MEQDDQYKQHYMIQRNKGWRYAYFHLSAGTLSMEQVLAYADKEIHPIGYTTGLREGIADYEEEQRENGE